LFEKIDEDPVTIATSSINLSRSTAHNVTIFNEKLSQEESENNKLKDEIISLKEEMNKRRKVECDMTPLKENILEQQDHLHDVKMERFTEIQKMVDKVKILEKHLKFVSQINLLKQDCIFLNLFHSSVILFLISDTLPTDFFLVEIENECIKDFFYVINGRILFFMYH
jgi:hypothetical protein